MVYDWHEARELGLSCIWEKSRRLVVSYLMGAIELYHLGMGRSKNLIVHLRNEDAMREVWRIYQMYEDLRTRKPDWRLPKLEFYGNPLSEKLEQLMFANGSVVLRHHQDSGGLQGSGFSGIRIEEISRYQYPSQLFAQALIVTQGSASSKGGFVYAPTNSSPNADWQTLKQKTRAREMLRLEGDPVDGAAQRLPGYAYKDLDNGIRYCALHFSADPGKGPDWAKIMKQAIPKREYDSEYDLHEDVYDGQPVYPDYLDPYHAPKIFHGAEIPFIEGSLLIGGWDGGQSLSPAFVLIQVTPKGQVAVTLEVCPNETMPMSKFAPMVIKRLNEWSPIAAPLIEHWGDPTIHTRNGSTGTTAAQVAQGYGIRIRPSSNALQPRLSAVSRLLLGKIGDRPQFILCARNCPTLREGFRGAYRFQEASKSEGEGGGRMFIEPLKNGFSHSQDSLQYAAIEALRRLDRSKKR